MTSPSGRASALVLAALALAVALPSAAQTGGAAGPDVRPKGPRVTIMLKTIAVTGVVLRHDDDTLTILPNGSDKAATIRWSDLDPFEARRLHRKLEPPAPAHDPAPAPKDAATVEMVDALKVHLKNSKVITGIEDVHRSTAASLCIGNSTVDAIVLARSDIARIEKVKAPVSEVMSPTARYRRRLARSKPENAEDHYRMAEFCRRLGLWRQMAEHIETISVIDPRARHRMAKKIAELRKKSLALKGRELRDKAVIRIKGRDWQGALDQIELLKTFDPDSEFLPELVAKVPGIMKSRDAELRRKVITSWYTGIDGALRRYVDRGVPDGPTTREVVVTTTGSSPKRFRGVLISRDDKLVVVRSLKGDIVYNIPADRVANVRSVEPAKRRDATFAEARAWATGVTGGISADVAATVAVAHGITEDSARKLWRGRMSKEVDVLEDGVRIAVAPFYSLRQAKYGPGSWLREGALSGPVGAAPIVDREAWWKALPREARVGILRAFCYEAVLKVTSVKQEKCPGCGGKGIIVRRGLGDLGARDSICTRCMGTGADIGISCR